MLLHFASSFLDRARSRARLLPTLVTGALTACAPPPILDGARVDPSPVTTARAFTLAVAPTGVPVLSPTTPALPALPSCDQAVVRGLPSDTCASADPRWLGKRVAGTTAATYCHFVWRDPDSPRLQTLAAPGRIVEFDCPVVGLAAPTPAPAVEPAQWQALQAAFRKQVGWTTWSPSPASPRVTVAVIDSAAWSYSDPAHDDTFGHGRLMQRLIADLACPLDPFLSSGACPLAIASVLAVPRIQDPDATEVQIDPINGGTFGTRGELARAIAAAVGRWEASHEVGARLVLNLSLGWEEQQPQALASKMADEAVRALLARASCLGAITVAAAGNRAAPANPTGGFLPAAWEMVRAPDMTACQQQVPAVIIDPGVQLVRPLVYAAAAVDKHDRALLSARPASQPRLVAPGLGAVTDDARAPGHTTVLSGSSVAAAVVSGIAAAVWEARGTLPAQTVMDRVYRAAVALDPALIPGAGATLCPTGPPCADLQHRVSLCAALSSVAMPHDPCQILPGGAGQDPLAPPAPPAAMLSACTGPACPAPPASGAGGPWIWPQPNGAACPSCILFGCCGVLGAMDGNMPALKSPSLIRVVPWLFTDATPWWVSYAPVNPAQLFILPPNPAAAEPTTKATLVFELDGTWPPYIGSVIYTNPQDISLFVP